jgi:hypothetical protein
VGGLYSERARKEGRGPGALRASAAGLVANSLCGTRFGSTRNGLLVGVLRRMASSATTTVPVETKLQNVAQGKDGLNWFASAPLVTSLRLFTVNEENSLLGVTTAHIALGCCAYSRRTISAA